MTQAPGSAVATGTHAGVAPALERAVGWMRTRRDQFSFRMGTDSYEQVLLLKPFSEFVLTLCLLRRVQARADWIDLQRWAWDECERGRAFVHLLAARPDLIDVAGIHASFREWGFRHSRLERLIGIIAALDSTKALEAPNWRRISLRYSLAKLGITVEEDGRAQGSWLQNRPEPWTICDGAAYAVTHEIFYRTDFGRRPTGLRPELRRYLALWLPIWTESFEAERNWDLVAELLLGAAFTGAWGAWAVAHLESLAGAQDSSGSFRGPRGAGRGLLDAHHHPGRREFLSSYHTTLVCILALVYCGNFDDGPGNHRTFGPAPGTTAG